MSATLEGELQVWTERDISSHLPFRIPGPWSNPVPFGDPLPMFRGARILSRQIMVANTVNTPWRLLGPETLPPMAAWNAAPGGVYASKLMLQIQHWLRHVRQSGAYHVDGNSGPLSREPVLLGVLTVGSPLFSETEIWTHVEIVTMPIEALEGARVFGF